MAQEFFADQTFTKVNTLAKADYECCSFFSCNFLNFDFSDFRFTECEFIDCDLSLIKLSKTILNDIKFTNCKLMGLHFEECNEFSLSFTFLNCILDHSSFYKRKIKKTIFKDTRLHEVDFSE